MLQLNHIIKFEKYKDLQLWADVLEDHNGEYRHDINVIIINVNLSKGQAETTIAHELAHFFYQYELKNHNERIAKRFDAIDNEDTGAVISEAIAHIVGHYGAEIEYLTKHIIKSLWKEQ